MISKSFEDLFIIILVSAHFVDKKEKTVTLLPYLVILFASIKGVPPDQIMDEVTGKIAEVELRAEEVRREFKSTSLLLGLQIACDELL